MSELTKRSFLFFLTSSFKSVGLLCVTFFLTPLLLRLIGASDFGTFKVLMEIYGYFSLLEMGLYSSLIACLIPAIRDSDQGTWLQLLSEGQRLYLKAALWTIVASLCLLPFLAQLTSWEGESKNELYFAFALVAASALLIPFQPYRIFLEASNQGHRINLIILLQNLLFMGVSILFAYLGWKLTAQAMGVLISNLIGVFLIRRYSGVRIPWTFSKHSGSLGQIRKHQAPQVLNDLAMKICLNCDQLIIALFLGPVMVTKVFLGQRVVLIMQGQIQSLGQASYASLGSIYYSDSSAFRARVMEVTKLLSVVGVSLLVPVCILNRPFIALWVGAGYQMESNALTYLASSNAFLFGLFSFWSFIFTVLGKPSAITKMIWWQAGVNLVASILCTIYLGGPGPMAGTLISFLLVPLWQYPKLLKEHFELPEPQLFSTIFKPLMLGLTFLLLHHFSPWKLSPVTWFTFFVYGALVFSLVSGLLFFALFNRQERHLFITRIKVLCRNFLKE